MASSMNTTCTKCGKEVSVNYLGRHYQRYHTLTAKTFPCNLCDKIFYEKLRLNQHTRARHNDNPDLIPNENLCIECGKAFISGERLQEHKATMQYACSGPGNSYLQSVRKGLSERQSLQETQSEVSPGTALFQMRQEVWLKQRSQRA